MYKDGDDPSKWARCVVESQLNSEARLVNLKSEIRKATRNRTDNDAKEYIFENVSEHLDCALNLVVEDSESGDLIREGMNLLKCCNKQSKITDSQPKRMNVTRSLTTPVMRNALSVHVRKEN